MFVFLDTKTTGTDKDDRLCQIAFKTEAGLIVNELFNPGKPIPIEAMSVNHITNEMVKDKPQYNLQYLRYYLKLNVDAKPHSQIREWGFSFGGVSIRYLIFRNLCARDKLYEI
jgi:hypothetical protein